MNPRFRQSPDRRVRSLQEAQEFVDDVGLAPFQGDKHRLPTFWGAVAGKSGPTPKWGESDRDYGVAWGWKDQLFSKGRIYYGKALGDYRIMISRRLLPYVVAACALGPTSTDEDVEELYADGLLPHPAKQLYEALREVGPASTTRLRTASRMRGRGEEWRSFEKALTVLQRALLVAPVGIDRDNRWKYTFRYAPLHVAFPEEVDAASRISAREARAFLTAHYCELVCSSDEASAARLFGWRVK